MKMIIEISLLFQISVQYVCCIDSMHSFTRSEAENSV